jgi:hypothetical protein
MPGFTKKYREISKHFSLDMSQNKVSSHFDTFKS